MQRLTKTEPLPYDDFVRDEATPGIDSLPMKFSAKTKAVVTDSHFLVPLVVFCVGLAILIALH